MNHFTAGKMPRIQTKIIKKPKISVLRSKMIKKIVKIIILNVKKNAGKNEKHKKRKKPETK